jgi:hypothetical protein
MRLFDEHPRTLEAMARCLVGPGSCHDCAMTCPYGNQVEDAAGETFPCGTEVFNSAGDILLCGDCAVDQIERSKLG